MVVGPLLAWYAVAEIVCLAPGDVERSDIALRNLLDRARESTTRLADEERTMYPALREAARQAGAGPFTDWALLDPLRRVVRCRTLGALDTMTLLDQVDAWLAHAPLEHLRPPPPDQ